MRFKCKLKHSWTFISYVKLFCCFREMSFSAIESFKIEFEIVRFIDELKFNKFSKTGQVSWVLLKILNMDGPSKVKAKLWQSSLKTGLVELRFLADSILSRKLKILETEPSRVEPCTTILEKNWKGYLDLLGGEADFKIKQRRTTWLFCYPDLEFLVSLQRSNKFYNRNVIEATKAFTF